MERESELRRVKQREYAEQQLRVEAEDQLVGAEREGREEAQRLAQRLAAGERETSELTGRVEALQRQLAEAEQAAAAERAALRPAERELQSRVADLERRAAEIQEGLLAERSARERSERELASIREGHRRMERVLGEIRAIVGRLGALLSSTRRAPEPPPVAAPTVAAPPRASGVATAPIGQPRGAEMADALAAAVERLRARALSAPPLPEDPQEPEAASPAEEPAGATQPQERPLEGRAPAPPAAPGEQAPSSPGRRRGRGRDGRGGGRAGARPAGRSRAPEAPGEQAQPVADQAHSESTQRATVALSVRRAAS